ncbi:MAG: hypothetical protein U0930_00660 [Pirellulales bacterium]
MRFCYKPCQGTEIILPQDTGMVNSPNQAKDEAFSFNKDSISYTERLTILLETKLDLVESLYTLSCSQNSLVANQDVSVTLGLIARRDVIVDQLLQVQSQLQTYQGEDPEQRVWQSEARRVHCRDVASRVEQMIKEILRLDEHTLETMCHQRDLVAAELQHGLDSNLAQRAYTSGDALQQPSVLDICDL